MNANPLVLEAAKIRMGVEAVLPKGGMLGPVGPETERGTPYRTFVNGAEKAEGADNPATLAALAEAADKMIDGILASERAALCEKIVWRTPPIWREVDRAAGTGYWLARAAFE